MVRSLSFIHLFIVLAVGYIGGALLFREIPVVASENWIGFFDSRVISSSEGSFIRPLLTLIIFFIVAFLLSMNSKTRHAILFVGAVKCVLFGLSSSYLLSSGMKLWAYTIWWFPFQLVTCYLYLLYCVVLSPSFFHRISRNRRNLQAIPILAGLCVLIFLIEMTIFHFLIK
ncbi:hypothetical protein [Sporosarcina highlanderae]|uniref:Uncharacterized protein n=1 Tax=Sporosarcina highlanderae TaxID=3035916 RepID=A0ABT8JQA0_9BACL|nr:hypothetical protein [Sporosarcina highlanderae]MDN4607330.1 hypothetical protein [Sporosarcina highlanderae]